MIENAIRRAADYKAITERPVIDTVTMVIRVSPISAAYIAVRDDVNSVAEVMTTVAHRMNNYIATYKTAVSRVLTVAAVLKLNGRMTTAVSR